MSIHVESNSNPTVLSPEFEIAVNGPNLAQSETVTTEATCSRAVDGLGDWHFVRTTVLERLKIHTEGSEVLYMILKKNNIPFMNL